MAILNNTGTELMWVDAAPDSDLPFSATQASIGSELYWIDGSPVQYLKSDTNNRSSFLLVFI